MSKEKNHIIEDLPEGWKVFLLSELCEINIGKTPPRSFPKYFLGDRTWLSIRDLKGKKVYDSNEKVTEEAVKKFGIRTVEKGTLMMSFKLTLGRLAFAGKDLHTNEAIAALPIKDNTVIDKYFLAYALTFIDLEEGIDNAVKGKTLNKKTLSELKIPVPPISLQKELIKQLDALFYRIDSALRLAQENVKHIKHLFPSVLNDTFEVESDSWKEYNLEEKFRLINGRAYNQDELLQSGKYKVIRIQNLNGGENWYHSDLELDDDKYCSKGDLLYSWSGTPHSSFGSFIWEHEKAIFHYHIWKVKFLDETIDKDFALHLFEYITEVAISQSHGGTGMMHVTKGKMEKFKIRVPDTETQKQVAEKLNNLQIKQKQLHQYYQQKQKQLKSLKASLLDAAFRGEFTQQATKAKVIQLPTETLSVVADDEAVYQTPALLNIPQEKRAFAKQVLAGKIISLFKDDPNFTPIKFQKLQYLAEHISQVDLNWNYYYQSAGPYDNKFMHSIDIRLQKAKWFIRNSKKYVPLAKSTEIDNYYKAYFNPVIPKLEKLFTQFYRASEAQSEIVATLYAVWNNLLIQEDPVSDEIIIEKFYQWSERKSQYIEEQLLAALDWIRKNNILPTGFGRELKKAKS